MASDTLAALDEARARGIKVILATGRIMSELRSAFPDVESHFDAIVAENGAVLFGPAGARVLVTPVDPLVSRSLRARGVAHRDGQALIACAAADELAALEVIREIGLDCRLVRNRSELMILPAGVTKGSGLLEALSELGLSPHNTIGVGDAENDHSLLEVCELFAAVANAVDAIRLHADVVLESRDGQGVAELLRGPILAGGAPIYPSRRQITLGYDESGSAVALPASQLNVAVCGGTGSGKSYLAGMMCEQLIRLGYSLVVAYPEGDHLGLGVLPNVLVLGERGRSLPEPKGVVRLMRYASVVVDLSDLDATSQVSWSVALPREVEAHRDQTGLPQWVVVDEAHLPMGRSGVALNMFNPGAKGYLLVTWRPEELAAHVVASLDAVIALCSPDPSAELIDLTAAIAKARGGGSPSS